MELYYKDLISEDASLEKLVDNLMRVVQGAEELAEAASTTLESHRKLELTSQLHHLKERCRRLQAQSVATAQATDKLLRQHPYSSLGVALIFGLMAGVLLARAHQPEA